MLSRLFAIIVKELIQIRRDPRTLGLVLVLPVMQLLLFGYAINTVIDHLPLVVYDESRDSQSRELVAALHNSSYFDAVRYVHDRESALAAIDSGGAKVALLIPPNYGEQTLRGETALAQLVVDGADPNVAQTALFAGGLVAQVHSGEILSRLASRVGRATSAGGVELRPVVLYNPSMLSVNFMIPGLVGLIMQFQTVALTAFAVVRERERGTLEQLVVTPIRSWELMLGKILPYTLTSSTAVVIALAVARLWFGVPISGSLVLLAVLSLVFLLGSLGVGLLVSTISQTQAQAMQIAVFIMLPSVMLSGFIFPREGMPVLIQQVSLLIPLTYFLQILRGVILKGVGLEVLWPQVVPLAIFGVAVFTISALRFRKRLG
ncbi:MAG: ABC transporter permease [Chloroflexi bacterium]|nr:ABC transporter permease [Chloroflexota bacterium]